MFREESFPESALEAAPAAWRTAAPVVAPAPASALQAAFAGEETGAVAHVYREIAQRIARNAFTRHVSGYDTAAL